MNKHVFVPSKVRPDLCSCGQPRGVEVHQVVEFDLNGTPMFEVVAAESGFKIGIYISQGGKLDGGTFLGVTWPDRKLNQAILLNESARIAMSIALLAGIPEATEFVEKMIDIVGDPGSYDPLNPEGEAK